jgi:hypothetical protein
LLIAAAVAGPEPDPRWPACAVGGNDASGPVALASIGPVAGRAPAGETVLSSGADSGPVAACLAEGSGGSVSAAVGGCDTAG